MDFEKKEIDQVKFYLSTIFNRQMDYVITVPQRDTMLQTTIDYSKLSHNNIDMDDAIHLVKFKNLEIVDKLYEKIFYNLQNQQCFIHSKTLMTEINKCLKLKILTFDLVINKNKIYLTYQKPHEDTYKSVSIVCGKLLTNIEIEKYLNVLENLNNQKTGVIETESIKLDFNMQNQMGSIEKKLETGRLNIFISGGHNLPNINGFLKKLETEYILNLITKIDKGVLRYHIFFSNDDLEIESYIPKNIFFIKNLKEIQ